MNFRGVGGKGGVILHRDRKEGALKKEPERRTGRNSITGFHERFKHNRKKERFRQKIPGRVRDNQ